MNKKVESYDFGEKDVLPEVIICFSHLRWDFVYQRPQHILSRLADAAIVCYIEEPVYEETKAHLTFSRRGDNIIIVVPILPSVSRGKEETLLLRSLLDEFMENINPENTAFWYYTPMALKYSCHIKPRMIIFDCMDELSAFKFAPEELKELEQQLLSRADVVFTGGASLFDAKKDRHSNIYLFPSSIDKEHFQQARSVKLCPDDQLQIPHPRLGFFGVIDERFDVDLVRELADSRPDWQLIFIGPVVKIDSSILPRRDNIHYLGPKPYAILPDYLAGWDIALLPFAINDSTRFISPTKTPEYLAAGIPVISTPLVDVVTPYGDLGLVSIADNAAAFVNAAERLLHFAENREEWLSDVDDFLKDKSWDDTCLKMKHCIADVMRQRSYSNKSKEVTVNNL